MGTQEPELPATETAPGTAEEEDTQGLLTDAAPQSSDADGLAVVESRPAPGDAHSRVPAPWPASPLAKKGLAPTEGGGAETAAQSGRAEGLDRAGSGGKTAVELDPLLSAEAAGKLIKVHFPI